MGKNHNVMPSCSFLRLVTTARVAVAGYVNCLIEMSAIGLLVNISFGRCRYFLFKRCICKSLLKVINYARIAVNFSIRSLRCPPYCLHMATGDKRRMDTEERFMNIHTEVVCGSGHSRRVPGDATVGEFAPEPKRPRRTTPSFYPSSLTFLTIPGGTQTIK